MRGPTTITDGRSGHHGKLQRNHSLTRNSDCELAAGQEGFTVEPIQLVVVSRDDNVIQPID